MGGKGEVTLLLSLQRPVGQILTRASEMYQLLQRVPAVQRKKLTLLALDLPLPCLRPGLPLTWISDWG